jgi:hypothetical protein
VVDVTSGLSLAPPQELKYKLRVLSKAVVFPNAYLMRLFFLYGGTVLLPK